MNKQKEKFNKEIENIKKKSYSWKITELKSIEIFKRRISDPEDRPFEIILSEKQLEKRMKVKPAYRTYGTQWKETVFILQEFQKGQRKRTENIFKARMVEDFPNMGREGDLKIQETKGILKRLNWKVLQWHILQLNCQESKKKNFKTNNRKTIIQGSSQKMQIFQQKLFRPEENGLTYSKYWKKETVNQKYYWWSCSSEAFSNKNWGNSSPLDMLYKKC